MYDHILERRKIGLLHNIKVNKNNFLAWTPLYHTLNFHISGWFESIFRHLRGARFKIFSNHRGITAKFKLLGEEIRYLMCAVGESISSFHQNIYPWVTLKIPKAWRIMKKTIQNAKFWQETQESKSKIDRIIKSLMTSLELSQV